MSFPAPQEGSEPERQMQDDYSRRQQIATPGHPHHHPFAMGHHPPPHMGSDPASYYARPPHPHGAPPYGRPPHGQIPSSGADPAGYGMPGAEGPQAAGAARLYDQRHHLYPPPGMPPGYPYMHHDPRYPPPPPPGYPPHGYGPQSPPGQRHSLPPGYPPPPHPSSLASAAHPPQQPLEHSAAPAIAKSPLRRESSAAEQASSSPKAEATAPGSPGETEEPPSPEADPAVAAVPSRIAITPLSKKNTLQLRQVDNTIVDEGGEQVWYTGCLPLGLADDKYWLSELQVYLRSNFAEAFGATEDDIAAPMHGRNKPIVLGQVGIRCMHCKHDNPAERGQQATSYPSQISGIYNSVQQMLRLHLDCCLSMPAPVRARIEALRLSCSSRGGRKQYWVDSARRLGLVDTQNGIHFGRDPTGPLPPLSGPSVNFKENRKKKLAQKAAQEQKREDKKVQKEMDARDAALAIPLERPQQPPPDSAPLVFPQDKLLISDYLYLTLEQMAPCTLMEADRVGCYKTRQVGFPGLACKHCVGQAGCGRYFPASEASLSQTTTSQTIMNHVRNCRRCPIEIRENLEMMKRNRMGPDGKRADKPKHGGRKVFFSRLWCRVHGIPFEEGKEEEIESKKKKLYKKPGPVPKGKRKRDDSDGASDTEEDDQGSYIEDEAGDTDAKPKSNPVTVKRKPSSPWYEGCVPLAKKDDTHWLTEMDCLARKELVEVFSLRKTDVLDGHTGHKEPSVGQVGIRCVFCKHVEPQERSAGCVSFPDMLSSIATKVSEMVEQHHATCPSMPESVRETFETIRRANNGNAANEDAQQYWVDAARDLGLANIPPDGVGSANSWGVTFRRDPLQPSPADMLDAEDSAQNESLWGKNIMVEPDDRGVCTDMVLLMLSQVRPCRFRKSDRRAGFGARGRDRSMGFPGLACMHCSNKNSLGRYFPVSAKNLTDNTANSLQAHISACSRCPEPIQASLAYLAHRSVLQKAELSGTWKKSFFKTVWDRLHAAERTWTAIEEEEGNEFDSEEEHVDDSYPEEAEYEEKGDEEQETAEGNEEGEEGEGDEKGEVGNQMNALIKAAAIWLTEQDGGGKGKSPKGGRPATRSGSATSLPTNNKRRRGNP